MDFFSINDNFWIFQLVKNTLFAIIGTKKIMLCSQFVYFNKIKTSYSQHVCYQHWAEVLQTQFNFIFTSTKKHKRIFQNSLYLSPLACPTTMAVNNFNILIAIWLIEIPIVSIVDVAYIASQRLFQISILQYLKIDFDYFRCKWFVLS